MDLPGWLRAEHGHRLRADDSVLVLCGDRRMKDKAHRPNVKTVAEALFGYTPNKTYPYGGLALALVPDWTNSAIEYWLWQLSIARDSFGVSVVREVMHGGRYLCAGYKAYASEQGAPEDLVNSDSYLRGLQEEAAHNASELLATIGIRYLPYLYTEVPCESRVIVFERLLNPTKMHVSVGTVGGAHIFIGSSEADKGSDLVSLARVS